MAPVEISEAEIIEALRAATDNSDRGPSDAFTRGEIATAMGWGLTKTSQQLQRLKARGRLEAVTVKREGIDGRLSPVAGYRFLNGG